MSTSKFKVGDKIRCRNNRYYASLTVGKLYKIEAITPSGLNSLVNDDYDTCSYPSQLFELVEPVKEYLTPEEVFEHLRKGTQLQVKDCGWQDKERHATTFREIIHCTWRIKPEPEIITLNGKRYQALED